MSAAVQLPAVWAGGAELAWTGRAGISHPSPAQPAAADPAAEAVVESAEAVEPVPAEETPDQRIDSFRRHTERLLRRYLYASMQVGRSPSLLNNPVARGWASSRPVRTFEDAVIFVLDVETCLGKLDSLERELLGRIVLQEYTYAETAVLIGMSTRAVAYKYPRVVDKLTELLLEARLLVLRH